MKQASNLLLLLYAILFSQCKTTNHSTDTSPQNDTYLFKEFIQVLDSVAAAEAIIRDNMEGFFEKIRTLDMEIQLGETLFADTKENVQAYKDFLKTEVSNFKKDEIEFVHNTMNTALELCDKISHDIFPARINLIKTKANHYGKSVYYTRENCIVIPYDVLAENRDDESFLEVMLHEIFHIYSRQNLDKRNELYRLIGFEKTSDIIFPEALDHRILLNPDGLDIQYVITLSGNGETTQVVPLLYSKFAEIQSEKRGFFGYTQFELFELKKENDTLQIQINENGTSTLPEYFQADFHRQIGPNTGYIIHPDEILADNFALLALSQHNLFDIKQLKPEGQLLLQDIKTILQE